MPWISNCTTSVIFALVPFLLGVLTAQTLEPGDHPPPGPRLFKWNSAGVYAGLRDRMADHRKARDVNIIDDQQVAADRAGTADLAALADDGAAGNPGASGDGRMCTEAYVVADLDLVVELHAIRDHGIAD